MTLPASVPIDLLQIQTEFASGSLADAAVAAGLATLSGTDLQPDKSMQDFLGLSNYSYVSEYGGVYIASTAIKSAMVDVKPTIGGSFTVSVAHVGSGSDTSEPNFTPTRWINPTSKAADVYAGLYVRATAVYNLYSGGGDDASFSGPGLIAQSVHGFFIPGEGYTPEEDSGTQVGSWVSLSSAAAGTYGWTVAGSGFNQGSTAGCEFTIDISTSASGSPIVASNVFYCTAGA